MSNVTQLVNSNITHKPKDWHFLLLYLLEDQNAVSSLQILQLVGNEDTWLVSQGAAYTPGGNGQNHMSAH